MVQLKKQNPNQLIVGSIDHDSEILEKMYNISIKALDDKKLNKKPGITHKKITPNINNQFNQLFLHCKQSNPGLIKALNDMQKTVNNHLNNGTNELIAKSTLRNIQSQSLLHPNFIDISLNRINNPDHPFQRKHRMRGWL